MISGMVTQHCIRYIILFISINCYLKFSYKLVHEAKCDHFNLCSTHCTVVSMKVLTFCYYRSLHTTILRQIAQVTFIDPIGGSIAVAAWPG